VTFVGFGAGGGVVDFALVGAPAGGPRYAALTVTLSAPFASPTTGIAPFSNVAASAGESSVTTGAVAPPYGTVMYTRAGVGLVFPVSESVAVTSNWFRPRTSETCADHRPSGPAVTRTVSRPGVSTETVAPAVVVPRSVYAVAAASASMTAFSGSVIAIDGGWEKRKTWTPR
jgi:hypothetical protein